MKLKVLFTTMMVVLLALQASAQSSDNVKYIFLFDVSGSTASADPRHHLKSLLLKAINAVGKPARVDAPSSFSIIMFGSGASSIEFDIPALSNTTLYSTKSTEILDAIDQNVLRSKFNQYSHIDAALTALQPQIATASGVFIFTDGRMLPGDVDSLQHRSLPEYLEKVRTSIAKLRSGGMPVFLIQSSPLLSNPYMEPLEDPVFSTDSVKRGKYYFWTQSLIKKIDNVSSEFERFMAEAQQPMQDSKMPEVVVPEPFDAMISVNKADVLMKSLTNNRVAIPAGITGLLIMPLVTELFSLLSKGTLPLEDVARVKTLIEEISARPAELGELVTKLKSAARSGVAYPDANAALLLSPKPILSAISATTPVAVPSGDIEEIVVKGLADYVIKRSKEEGIIFFLEEVDRRVKLTSTYVRDTLFNHTFRLLANFESTSRLDLLLIKEAVNEDMDNLVPNLLLHPRLSDSDELIGLLYGYELAREIVLTGNLKASFGSLLRVRQNHPGLRNAESRAEKGIVMCAKLVEELQKYDLENSFGSDPFDMVMFSKQFVIFYSDQRDFTEIELANIQATIAEIYRKYRMVDAQIKELRRIAQKTPESGYAEYRDYRRSILLDVIDQSGKLMAEGIMLAGHMERAGEDQKKAMAIAAKLRETIKLVLNAWTLIEDRQYPKAVMLLLPILSQVIATNPNLSDYRNLPVNVLLDSMKAKSSGLRKEFVTYDKDKVEALRKKVETLTRPSLTLMINDLNTTNSLAAFRMGLARNNLSELEPLIDGNQITPASLDAAIKFLESAHKEESKVKKLKSLSLNYPMPSSFALEYIKFNELNQNFKNLISIAGEVSSAKEANDITNILTKYALPPASYRAKRERGALMINAYAGIGTGLYTSDGKFSFVVGAPIGLEGSLPWKNKKGSVSLLLSPIDIGNVINYQLVGDSAKDPEEVFSLKNIYTPGTYLMIGLSKHHPFSIGTGYEWLSKRVTVLAAFDLPMFRIR